MKSPKTNVDDKVSWLPASAIELQITNDMSKENETIETKSHAPLSGVSDFLSVKEVAARYGQKLKCKWLDLYGQNWEETEAEVNADFIRQVEQGSIKDCH